jgi:hypothetical protein
LAPVTAETILCRAEGIVHADLREESVLLDTSTGVALRLNAAGAWLWDRLEEPTPLGKLADALASRFEIEVAQALSDTSAFAETMLDRGLLDRV